MPRFQCFVAERIPEAALARMDGGDVPSHNGKGEKLHMPTVVEAAIFSRIKPMQTLMVVATSNRPRDLQPSAVRAHGLAFANADPDIIRAALPMRASELNEVFTVLCIDVCKDRAEMERKIATAKELKVGRA